MNRNLYIGIFLALSFLAPSGFSFAQAESEPLQKSLDELGQMIDYLQKDIMQQRQEVKENLERLQNENELLRSSQHSEEEINVLKDKIGQLEQENALLESGSKDSQDFETKIQSLNDSISKFRAENSDLKSELEMTLANIKQLEKDKLSLKSQLEGVFKEKKIAEPRAEKSSADELKNKLSALMGENEKLKEEIRDMAFDLGLKRESPVQGAALSPNEKKKHFNLGYAYAGEGNLDAAIDEFRQVLRLDPDDADSHYNLGYLYAKKGFFLEAINEYETVLALSPNDKETYYNLTIIYRKHLKDEEKAKECYKEFLKDVSKDKKPGQ
jgi:tetratricopeptide (TPR) repeat protein